MHGVHDVDAGRRAPVRRLPYLPGVDGLRGLAVVAVVLYHADVSWMRAGFLGVDVFFTISGFLITSLLLAEHRSTGGIGVVAFWLRRARRLLPALFALLAGVTVAAALFARDAAGRLTGDLPAAALYVSNWWQVVDGESYFEAIGRPPLLQHLWSLAVEEQFYVLAPLVILFALRRRLGPAKVAAGALALAVASAIWMAIVWSPEADTSRAYFGTDTHAAPILVGVALGAVWRPTRLRATVTAGARRVLDGAGAVALAALAALAVGADEFGRGLYHGGFLLAGVAAGVAVAVASHPASRLGRLLGRQPLWWIGTRSYSIYLWHWPVVVLTRPHLDVPLDGLALLALRLALSGALAELSWRYVEQPFREGRAQRAFRARPAVERRRISAGILAGAVAGWLVVSLVAVPPAGDVTLVAAAEGGAESTLATWPSTTAEPGKKPLPTTATTVPAAPDPTTPPTEPTTTAPPAPPVGPILAVGDSVLLAVRPALERASNGAVQVDAAVGRQVWDVLELLERYRDAGDLARLSALVVHLGTNGPLSASDFERLARAVEGVPRVVVLTVRVPRRWEGTSNASIVEGVPRYPWMRLVDWYAASGQPGMLASDGVHPTPQGIDVYTQLVLEQLAGVTPPPPPPTTTTTSTTTTATTAPPPPPETTTTTAAPPPTTVASAPPAVPTTTTTTPSSTTSTTATTLLPL